LREGKIIAVKGLGGFLLVCDASSDAAVSRLRQRKNRSAKPLAVMLSSLEEASRHCYVNTEEEKLLTSTASPIVLLKWKAGSTITPEVAPGLKYLGVMLPYIPLQHILLRETGLPLVMTSGNLSEEPISKDNEDAWRRLAGIADYFLVHDRDIYVRCDDSVTAVVMDIPSFTRRARGFAPNPIHLKYKSRQVLGCGAEEKTTFCVTRDSFAFLSQHIGTLENTETLDYFIDTIAIYKRLFRIEPEILAYDLHPEYLSTKYAREYAAGKNIRLVPVQHHHAHIVSCMADNGLTEPVIGVSFDGTGYGTDGHIWGGEFLIADYKSFTRMGHIEYLPLPGGTIAIKKPYRTAIGYLVSLFNDLNPELAFLKNIDPLETDIIKRQVEKGINAPLTSSCGRLFDAVSALIGIRGEIEYEAQAAIELEMVAYDESGDTGIYPFKIVEDDGINVVRLGTLFAAIMSDLQRETPGARIAARFHNTVTRMIASMCRTIFSRTGTGKVALSGGVFQNRLLLEKTVTLLDSEGFEVLIHRQVPCNDGGISLGQAVVGNAVVTE
jgi:hydrogenase maturation protein HypF